MNNRQRTCNHRCPEFGVADALKRLPVFPDVLPGLDALRDRRLAVLSNGTVDGIRGLVANSDAFFGAF